MALNCASNSIQSHDTPMVSISWEVIARCHAICMQDKKDVHRERNLQLHRQKGSEQDDYGEINTCSDSTQDRDMPFRSQTDTMEDRVPRLERRRTSGGAGDAVQDQRGSQVSPETKARPSTRISSTPTESYEYRQARDPLGNGM